MIKNECFFKAIKTFSHQNYNNKASTPIKIKFIIKQMFVISELSKINFLEYPEMWSVGFSEDDKNDDSRRKTMILAPRIVFENFIHWKHSGDFLFLRIQYKLYNNLLISWNLQFSLIKWKRNWWWWRLFFVKYIYFDIQKPPQ